MKKIFFLSAFLCGLHGYAQDTIKTDANLQSAIVYFGYGAELTHHARLKASTGTRFLVINKLSTSIDVNSLQISCPEDVALLSHRYNVIYPTTPAIVRSREVTRLTDSIALLNKEIYRIQNNIAIENETL